MSFRESPNPHLKRTGLVEIRDAIKHHCGVINSDQPPEFFALLTDALPAHDPAHQMQLTDDTLMKIATQVDDAARKHPVPKGYYAPEAVSALLNGVLSATRHATDDETYAWSKRVLKPSQSQHAADAVVAVAQANFAAGRYERPDARALVQGQSL
jgi:hypothetical protein